jgi:hypothetical protein
MTPCGRSAAVVGDRVEPEHRDAPAAGPAVALERLDGRGLAGAVRPEHDQDLARLGLQVRPSTAVDLAAGRAGRSVART